MKLIYLLVFLTSSRTAWCEHYGARDVKGRILDDTLTVSSRLYPTKVKADEVQESTRRIRVNEHRPTDSLPIGEIKDHGETKNFPVSSTYTVQDNPKHKGLVFDETLSFTPRSSSKYNDFNLDEFNSHVTDSYRSTAEPKLGEHKRKGSGKKTKYIADFDNAFEIPEDKLPKNIAAGSNIEIVKAPKIEKPSKKKQQSQYTNDFNLKEIQLEHDKHVDSYTKQRPAVFDINPFTKVQPLEILKPIEIKPVKPITIKITPTQKPIFTIKLKTKSPVKYTISPIGAASHNTNIKYSFEGKPKNPRLESFIKDAEDEKLESAVREALIHLKKGQRGKQRANFAAATKINPVRHPSPGGPKGPRRPRRPINPGPQPVRVFNFNN